RARGRASRGGIITTILAAAVLAGWDELHWSYIVLAAAGLTVLYAAAVSLALPEQWEVARHDVTLATLWIALAVGTPIALASGLFILVSAAFAALLESVWMPPHRAYIAIMATSVWTVTGVIGLATGAAAAADPATAVAAVLVIMVVLFLELAHAGRRLAPGEAPPDLDMAAADPVPAGAATFRALERAVTVASAGFAVFEQRAGVWLAAVLIVALLVWSTR